MLNTTRHSFTSYFACVWRLYLSLSLSIISIIMRICWNNKKKSSFHHQPSTCPWLLLLHKSNNSMSEMIEQVCIKIKAVISLLVTYIYKYSSGMKTMPIMIITHSNLNIATHKSKISRHHTKQARERKK